MNRSQPVRARGGFTLIELMVVLAIIAILATIGLYVGRRVSEGGKSRVTANTLQLLDQMLTSYKASKGQLPRPYFDAYNSSGQPARFPIIDARTLNADSRSATNAQFANVAEPSLSLLLAAMVQEDPGVSETLKRIDPSLMVSVDSINTGFINSGGVADEGAPRDANRKLIKGVIIKDGWGNAIRFVHPEYHGGYGNSFIRQNGSTSAYTQKTRGNLEFVNGFVQVSSGSGTFAFRRSAFPFDPDLRTAGQIGDADEGLCTNGAPYFYSCGSDGDPGTRADNIYSLNKPTFAVDTRAGNNFN
jgi:prepilin-type N-terminal cleavage/methylation domain-containing protein